MKEVNHMDATAKILIFAAVGAIITLLSIIIIVIIV